MGIDINKVMNEEKKQTMSAFGVGYVAVVEPGTGIRMMKPVVNVRREDVESFNCSSGRFIKYFYRL